MLCSNARRSKTIRWAELLTNVPEGSQSSAIMRVKSLRKTLRAFFYAGNFQFLTPYKSHIEMFMGTWPWSVMVKFTTAEVQDVVFSEYDLIRYYIHHYIWIFPDTLSKHKYQVTRKLKNNRQCSIIFKSQPIPMTHTPQTQRTSVQGWKKENLSLLHPLRSSIVPINPVSVITWLYTEEGTTDHQLWRVTSCGWLHQDPPYQRIKSPQQDPGVSCPGWYVITKWYYEHGSVGARWTKWRLAICYWF